MSIREWLEGLGFGEYAEAFERNGVDRALLPEVTNDDLKDLGVARLADRKRILIAIDALRSDQPQEAPTASHHPVSGSARPSSVAERRQITVMFCDLVGSTALSEALDVEDLRALMQAYQEVCGRVIDRYEGHVAQYLGDGLMTYFGWPAAHEDDAERAVRAAIEILEAVKAIPSPAPLQVRIGIATGSVVVGETGAGDASVPKLAIGETPNLAARVQGLAEPDEIVIAPPTRRLVGGAFILDDLGHHSLKGIVEPVRAWRVTGLAPTESRFDAAHGAHLTAFVGREAEIALLMEKWARVQDGEGQVVLLGGEPGIGKSRILQEVRARIEAEPHSRLRYQCSPYHTNSALYPVIEQFIRAAGFRPGDDTTRKLEKVESLVGTQGNTPALFAAMLGLYSGERYAPLDMSQQRQKEETLKALAEQVTLLAAHKPVLMLFEDAHWIDPTTQETLALIVPRIAAARVLLLITCRSEYAPSWSQGLAHVSTLNLSRLGRRQVAEIVVRVTGGRALPDALMQQIVAKTDGVPLFVEELTKAVLESGLLVDEGGTSRLGSAPKELVVPATLQDSLMARLDRLSPAKDVAQIGACIGREFPHALLAAVSDLSADQLQDAIEKLVGSELVFRTGTPPEATYTFKHALVQDAAYASLLKSRRYDLHGRIAEALKARLEQGGAQDLELLALHFGRAGKPVEAVGYWLAASREAARRTATREAIAHAKEGLEIVAATPELPDRERVELDLRAVLATQQPEVEGFAPAGLRDAVDRVLELGLALEAVEPLCRAIGVVWQAYLWHGRMPEGRPVIKSILDLAEKDGRPFNIACVLDTYGMIHMQSGRWRDALALVERLKGLLDEIGDANLDTGWGVIPGQWMGVTEAYSHWMLGNIGPARDAARTAIGFAERHSRPFAIGSIYAWVGSDLGYLMRDVTVTERYARKALEVCERHSGFDRSIGSLAHVHLGWVETQQGRVEDGLARMTAAVDALRTSGARAFVVPRLLAEIAEVLGDAGRPEEGLRLLAMSPDRIDSDLTPSRFPEIYRIEGDLLLKITRPDPAAAQAKFEEAIEIARSEETTTQELRASTSLARLWHGQGRSTAARALLDDVMKRFPDPDNSDDYRAAALLMQTLLAPAPDR